MYKLCKCTVGISYPLYNMHSRSSEDLHCMSELRTQLEL